ncbi:hypothetical protein DPMN_101081 [Dreissena polymorpha]|uniref:Uncharacterized protein n=1 Tax=Dreissena polymorpha TaxID=45954 RepID=A0A9D4LH18_DREPO|nr:hypothetical protein DPMN_101081 [Dreissena polymorpha]
MQQFPFENANAATTKFSTEFKSSDLEGQDKACMPYARNRLWERRDTARASNTSTNV